MTKFPPLVCLIFPTHPQILIRSRSFDQVTMGQPLRLNIDPSMMSQSGTTRSMLMIPPPVVSGQYLSPYMASDVSYLPAGACEGCICDICGEIYDQRSLYPRYSESSLPTEEYTPPASQINPKISLTKVSINVHHASSENLATTSSNDTSPPIRPKSASPKADGNSYRPKRSYSLFRRDSSHRRSIKQKPSISLIRWVKLSVSSSTVEILIVVFEVDRTRAK